MIFGSEVLYMAKPYFLDEVIGDKAKIMHPKDGKRKLVPLDDVVLVDYTTAPKGEIKHNVEPTIEQWNIIKDLSLTINEVARRIGKRPWYVKVRRNKLGVKTKPVKSFSKEDIDYIKDNLDTPTTEIMKVVDFSRSSINALKRKLR